MSKVLAIVCADLHLCHTVPPARAAEPDWYAAMKRPIDQVRQLSYAHKCPVIAAGDIFNRWDSNPELINWAIDHLPKMYAIPGQHDLPHHNYEDIYRTAYWTLVGAGVIQDLRPNDVGGELYYNSDDRGSVMMVPFPWGFTVSPIEDEKNDCPPVRLAVVHKYIWQLGTGYPGAPDEARIGNSKGTLRGFDAAVFGDNHKGFDAKVGNCNVCNCGCLIRRKADEREYRPAVGLLHSDGKVTRHYLDVSEDKWIDPVDKPDSVEVEGLSEFMAELAALDADSLDFREAVNRWVSDNKVSNDVKQLLFDIMGE